MESNLKYHISSLLGTRITKCSPLSGGDISQAYLLETQTERFFCKLNRDKLAYKMFEAEKDGLAAISETKMMATPNVLCCEPLVEGAFLLMEYIESKKASPKDMALLGHHLATLHQHSESDSFGWIAANFIGSLPQNNSKTTDWPEFYVGKRLLPQLGLAKDNHLLTSKEIPTEGRLFKVCKKYLPNTRPSLLHGDLWKGNYLISKVGNPYLIDPSTYYGHQEVDIAMTRLFGGFDPAFYNAYSEHFQKNNEELARTHIYQLYYLLVHLNLFGSSYYGPVRSMLQRYF